MESDNDSNVAIVGQGDSVKVGVIQSSIISDTCNVAKGIEFTQKNIIDFIIYICTNELICT